MKDVTHYNINQVLIVPVQRYEHLSDALDDIIRSADYREYDDVELGHLSRFLIWYKVNDPTTAAQYERERAMFRSFVNQTLANA